MKRILLIVAKILLATGLITWLLLSGKLDFTELTGISQSWPWLLLAFGVFGCVLLMASLRWRLLLKAQGIDYSLHDTFALTLIGLFFSQVMIGDLGWAGALLVLAALSALIVPLATALAGKPPASSAGPTSLGGALGQAEAMFQKALVLFQNVGAAPQITQVQELLARLWAR